MRVHEQAAVRLHRVDQLAEALAREGRVDKMPLDAAGEFVFREFGQQLFQFAALGQKDVIVHVRDACRAVVDLRAGLGSGDEQAVLPLGQIHMPHLSVIQNGGEIHLQFGKARGPLRKGAFAVARSAGGAVVVQFSVKGRAAFVQA